MTRPKTGRPPKKNLTLTVNEKTRAELAFISEHYAESISSLISEYAAKEAKAIAERTGKEIPMSDK